MSETSTYEIVVRGRPSERLLRPLVDDFVIEAASAMQTRLVGEIRDSSQLHGVITHLTSVGVEVVRFGPADESPQSEEQEEQEDL